ncbi:polysaccharide biosynthesis/export family protein [Flavicella sediminum]|uniref:polysaccharide biosynthesis/export family protein n=1 Tax=Flavicella sediminum TaxID=2585141 RepID=UPI00111CB973|nr:polysaccharide biosynthesis/export family protein [Flavicella sediminum]
MKVLYNYCLLILVIGVFYSCAPRKNLVYFQGIEKHGFNELKDYSPILKPDDRLSISVSSIDYEATKPFNLPVAAFSGNQLTTTSTPQLQTYLIGKDGMIDFPKLGMLKLSGLTRLECVNLIEKKLEKYLQEPQVVMKLLNFSVSVLGEVSSPGIKSVTRERYTILDAIAAAKDLTVYGKRKNILVVRETEEGLTYNRIDLTSAEVFNSPVYYLQQNDVVYVEPNKPRINSSTNSSTNGIIISSVSLLLTIISITLR